MSQFKAPFGVVASVLSIGLIIWLLTDKKVLAEGLPILISAMIGLVIYVVYRLLGKKSSTEQS